VCPVCPPAKKYRSCNLIHDEKLSPCGLEPDSREQGNENKVYLLTVDGDDPCFTAKFLAAGTGQCSQQMISSEKSVRVHNKTAAENSRGKTELQAHAAGWVTGRSNRGMVSLVSCSKFTQLFNRHTTPTVLLNHFLFTIRFAFFVHDEQVFVAGKIARQG
jgi:hypothetical protein